MTAITIKLETRKSTATKMVFQWWGDAYAISFTFVQRLATADKYVYKDSKLLKHKQ